MIELSPVVRDTMVPAPDGALRADLARVARARAFFAHRSVGSDLIDGMARLAATAGDTTLRVVEVTREIPEDALGHALLGPNGDPFAKLADLERMLASGLATSARVVLFKFCYADFHAETDPTEVFHAYARVTREVRLRFPRLRFVHITAPLVAIESGRGLSSIARSMLGRTPLAIVENDRREQFNELLRRTFEGRDPVFDLATHESTTESGARVTRDLHGRPVAALASGYTHDGGHLNVAARLSIGRRLLATIANAAAAA